MGKKIGKVMRQISESHICFLRKFRIRSRMLVTFLSISILPLCIIALYSFWGSYCDVKEKIGSYSAQTTRQAAVNGDMILSYVEDISDRIIDSDIIQYEFEDAYKLEDLKRFKLDDEIMDLLNTNMRSGISIDGITIMNSRGCYSLHTGNKMIPLDYSKSWLYQTAISGFKKDFWQSIYKREVKNVSAIASEYLTVYVNCIRKKWNGDVLGVLMVSLNPVVFAEAFSGIDLWENSTVGIIDSKGHYIYCLDESRIGVKLEDEELVLQINECSESNQNFDYKEGDNKVLVSCKRLKHNGWIAVSMVPYSGLMNETNRILYMTIFTILICMVLAVYIAYITASSIAEPVNYLLEAIKQVEKGRRDINIDISGNDEMTYLNKSYKLAVDENERLINELYRAEIMQQKSQIQALKAQINPHFLYNTLDTINSIAKIHGEKEISSMIQGLSDMFRYSTKSGIEFVSLKEEIDSIRNYLNIIKMRFSEKLHYEITIQEVLYEYKIQKLILQPIVENAVRHGIELKKGPGLICVNVFLKDEKIVFDIIDDGIGISTETLLDINSKLKQGSVSGKGVGLSNVYRRLELYYKEKFEFLIQSEITKGTHVRIIIPAELCEEVRNV